MRWLRTFDFIQRQNCSLTVCFTYADDNYSFVEKNLTLIKYSEKIK